MHPDGLAPGSLAAKAAQHEAGRVLREAVVVVAAAGKGVSCTEACARQQLAYGDEKVANRDTTVWHGATEKGP
jgi:hypothetical protein